jgi:hypothetical protein
MPRGVYDRSKAAKRSEKTETEPKVKKARAPYGSKKAAKLASASTEKAEISLVPSGGGVSVMKLIDLAALRSNFTGPTANTLIVSKIDSLITDGLDKLIASTLEMQKKVIDPARQVQAPAPVQLPAPVQQAAPFNPVAPNGQA